MKRGDVKLSMLIAPLIRPTLMIIENDVLDLTAFKSGETGNNIENT